MATATTRTAQWVAPVVDCAEIIIHNRNGSLAARRTEKTQKPARVDVLTPA